MKNLWFELCVEEISKRMRLNVYMGSMYSSQVILAHKFCMKSTNFLSLRGVVSSRYDKSLVLSSEFPSYYISNNGTITSYPWSPLVESIMPIILHEPYKSKNLYITSIIESLN